MLFLILKNTLGSFVLIYLIHYLFSYFQNTLTVPKVRDLVIKQRLPYEEVITEKKDLDNKPNMKSELSTFLNDLKNK